MRSISPALVALVLAVACQAGGEGGEAEAGVGPLHADPLGPPGSLASADGGSALSCRCVADHGESGTSFDCAATRLPAGAALCQRGDGVIYCAPAGQETQTFTGDVACDPGFCVSLDGRTCAIPCDCAG